MVIGERFRVLRERKKFTQQDIEDRTGLKRCYLSRVENGNTVPSIHTIEKLAFALGVPMYRLFYEGEGLPPEAPILPLRKKNSEAEAKICAENEELLARMARILMKLDASSREKLFSMANLMADRRRSKPRYRKSSGPSRRFAIEDDGASRE
jgi:transcriptional regulator with XRE-family HTH domain